MPTSKLVGKLDNAKDIAKRKVKMYDKIKAKEGVAREDLEAKKAKRFFKENPSASLDEFFQTHDVEFLNRKQAAGYKGNANRGKYNDAKRHFENDPNADISYVMNQYGFSGNHEREKLKEIRNRVRYRKKKTQSGDTMNETTKTMQEETTTKEGSTSEAVSVLMDKMDTIEKLENKVEKDRAKLNTVSYKLGDVEEKVDANGGVIDAMREDINELNETVEAHGNSIDKLVEEVSQGGEKRYVGNNPTVTLELTDFEAMFIANRLWEAGEMHNEVGEERAESEAKWWARKIHGERNTRDS